MEQPIIFFSTSLTASILILFFTALLYNANKRIKRQRENLILLRHFRLLLSLFQKHRGLSNGFMNGGKHLSDEIKTIHKNSSLTIKDIANFTHQIDIDERWESITEHWSRLSNSYTTNSIENNLLQHNTLIRSCLFLMDDIEHSHELQLFKFKFSKNRKLLWQDLLYASEYIGQARALGTGVTALGTCSVANKITLTYLCNKIIDKTHTIWIDNPPSNKQKKNMDQFIYCLNQQVMKEQSTIKTDNFFAIASAALNGLHDQYDVIIEQSLQKTYPRITQRNDYFQETAF